MDEQVLAIFDYCPFAKDGVKGCAPADVDRTKKLGAGHFGEVWLSRIKVTEKRAKDKGVRALIGFAWSSRERFNLGPDRLGRQPPSTAPPHPSRFCLG